MTPQKTRPQAKKKATVADFSESYPDFSRFLKILEVFGHYGKRCSVVGSHYMVLGGSGWWRAHDKVVRIIITTNRPLQPWLRAWGPASNQPMRLEPGLGKARAAL